ncbi:MAG: trigger factor [Verrucomicrobia bacterium]|nr:trigger factor [Verrucomicrobiota bacterium]
MNIEVENLPNCLASLRVEIAPEQVSKEWDEVVEAFRKAAKIPGYRPGKAPVKVVETKFRKDIREELTKRLIGDTTRQAIKEKGLNVLTVSQVDDVELTPEKAMRFTATLVTSPEFELPEYKGIQVRVPSADISEAAVDDAMQKLRERAATFSDVPERALEIGDYAIIDYEISFDGKPVSEVFPNVHQMWKGGTDFWIKVDEETFFPGLGSRIVGMKIKDSRSFDLEIPADYGVHALANKTLHFELTLKAIKTSILPELDDKFAGQISSGIDLQTLKGLIRKNLQEENAEQIENLKREQIINHLVSLVECELPDAFVKRETKRIMSEIVQENQHRGVSEESLREHQKDIIKNASKAAKGRLKANFILLRIADKQGLKVTEEERHKRIQVLAATHRMSFEKMVDELHRNGTIAQVEEDLLLAKVLDFLSSNATVQTSPEKVVAG